MNLCTTKCLYSNCQNLPTRYANFSKFHKVCTTHCQITGNYPTLTCGTCKNNIKILPAEELWFENSVHNSSSPFQSYESTSNKCLVPSCVNQIDYFMCSMHQYCASHNQFSDYHFCDFCFCSVCRRTGAYIKTNSQNLCPDCYSSAPKCVYCSDVAINKFEKCDHYYCAIHWYSLYLCSCTTCVRCSGTPVKTKSCFHDYECECEFKALCNQCITIKNQEATEVITHEKNNESLKDSKNAEKESKGIVFNCEIIEDKDIFDKSNERIEIKGNSLVRTQVMLCDKCEKNEVSCRLGCQHMLCEDCFIFNSCSICIPICCLCNKKPMFQIFDCKHGLCEDCSSLKYCPKCNEGKFCRECFYLQEKGLLLFCQHGKCKDCVEKRKCEKCTFCSVCNGKISKPQLYQCIHARCNTCIMCKCNLCDYYSCSSCGEKSVFKNFLTCKHLFCSKCAESFANHL